MSIWKRLLGGGSPTHEASVPAPPPPPPPEPTPAPPWDPSRPSIHAFLRAQPLDAAGRLPEEASELPDQDVYFRDSEIRWVSGGMDGAIGHLASSEDDDRPERVFALIKDALDRPSPETEGRLYARLMEGRTLGFVDGLADLLADDPTIDGRRLAGLALWLATGSPDREPVKLGIALLGLVQGPSRTDLVVTLGRHDEFTLFAMVAIGNTLPEAERDRVLWGLAREVDGWGRVQLVRHLADSADPEIERWLLREGYRNSVMN